MTATRERQSAPAEMPGETSWAERSAFGTTRGVPLWAAVLLAVLPTAIGALIDQLIFQRSGVISTICFVLGCLASVALVHRRSVFGPTVQTPLVVSIVLPLVAVLTDTSKGGGSGKIFTIAKPLINNFPMMAVTALLALGIGLLRLFRLQPARDNPAYQPKDKSQRRGLTGLTGSFRAPKAGPRSGPQDQGRAREQAPDGGRRPRPGPKSGQRPNERDRPDRSGQRPDGRRDPRRKPSREEQQQQRSGEQQRGREQRGGQQQRGGQPERGGPPGRGAPPPGRGGQGRPSSGGRGPREQGGKPPSGGKPQRGDHPQRPGRGGPPPGRGGQQPGRGRPSGPREGGGNQPPPQRPRKPKRNDFWD